jgi:hypothetical protein
MVKARDRTRYGIWFVFLDSWAWLGPGENFGKIVNNGVVLENEEIFFVRVACGASEIWIYSSRPLVRTLATRVDCPLRLGGELFCLTWIRQWSRTGGDG